MHHCAIVRRMLHGGCALHVAWQVRVACCMTGVRCVRYDRCTLHGAWQVRVHLFEELLDTWQLFGRAEVTVPAPPTRHLSARGVGTHEVLTGTHGVVTGSHTTILSDSPTTLHSHRGRYSRRGVLGSTHSLTSRPDLSSRGSDCFDQSGPPSSTIRRSQCPGA